MKWLCSRLSPPRAKLHEAIRRGAIRVCVGSTAPLIGQAVNVQDRLIALSQS